MGYLYTKMCARIFCAVGAFLALLSHRAAAESDEHPMFRFLTEAARKLVWHPGHPPIGFTEAKYFGGPECRPGATFTPTNLISETKWPICLRPGHDVVTNYIDQYGSWPDCAILPALYFDVAGRRAHWTGKNGVNQGRTLFFDIGSNIGSCSMEMLVRLPEVQIIAVEPSPFNHFYLTRSMIQLAAVLPSVLERFLLLPVAVGNSTAAGRILYLRDSLGNKGATELGVHGYTPTRNEANLTAQIWAMDKLVNGAELHKDGSLVKMDIQGVECHAVDGMTNLLKGVGVLKTELNPPMLEKQGCGPKANNSNSLSLIQQFSAAGFDVESENGDPADTIEQIQLAVFDSWKYRAHNNIDIIARKPHPVIQDRRVGRLPQSKQDTKHQAKRHASKIQQVTPREGVRIGGMSKGLTPAIKHTKKRKAPKT